MQDLEQFVKWTSSLSVTGVLVLFVLGLIRGWFVTGREHSTLATLLASVQADQTAMRTDLRLLRDRDESQQNEINKLREELAASEKEKHAALEQVEALTKENVALRNRVAELERTVGLNSGPRT